MASLPNRNLDDLNQSELQRGEELQIDYSYNQWRQDQMQQLERNYEEQCERAFSR